MSTLDKYTKSLRESDEKLDEGGETAMRAWGAAAEERAAQRKEMLKKAATAIKKGFVLAKKFLHK